MAMERSNMSYQDLLDGIHKLSAAGFPRVDSEAIFQDFLRRIPSSGQLSAADSFNYLDPEHQSHLQQTVQQIQQQQAAQQEDIRRASSGLQEAGTLEVKEFPRVASLDYLQQLVQQSAGQAQNLKQAPATSDSTADDHERSPLTDVPVSAPAQRLPNFHTAGPTTGQTGPQTVPMLSAPLQLPSMSSAPQSSAPVKSSPPEPGDSKAEVRRARRMLSNRESARRSRRRKQEQLSTMEGELQQVQDDKAQMASKVEDQAQTIADQQEELQTLRAQLADCRARLKRGGLSTADDEAAHPAKRLCNGHSRTHKVSAKAS